VIVVARSFHRVQVAYVCWEQYGVMTVGWRCLLHEAIGQCDRIVKAMDLLLRLLVLQWITSSTCDRLGSTMLNPQW